MQWNTFRQNISIHTVFCQGVIKVDQILSKFSWVFIQIFIFVNTSEIRYGQILRNECITGVWCSLRVSPTSICLWGLADERKQRRGYSPSYDDCCVFWFGLVLEMRVLCELYHCRATNVALWRWRGVDKSGEEIKWYQRWQNMLHQFFLFTVIQRRQI